MASKKRMYVPVNFTVAPDTKMTIENCTVNSREGFEHLTMNCYKDHFEGEVHLEDWEIWVDESPIVFMDKLNYYLGTQEERLV
jgi:hypothetical protein